MGVRASTTDLTADRVLLLIERPLVGAGEVPAVESRHCALLVADRAILAMQPARLLPRHLAFADFTMNAAILVLQPVIDLIAPRVVVVPSRFC